jgi:5-(carboxyamino)imidazole ribonucleotide synthase
VNEAEKMPVVGMIGGGQLARMTQQAAIALGVRLRVLAAAPDESAAQVCADVRIGNYRNPDDVLAFVKGCDVVTFDHEHVPGDLIAAIEAAGVPARPGPAALAHAQDKLVMRTRLADLGVPMPAFAPVGEAADVAAFAERTGWPVVLKAIRGGYDGRGVWVCETPAETQALLDRGDVRLMAEEYVPFRRELAALVARSPHGQGAAYPVVQTVQRDGICREVIAGAVDGDAAEAAQHLALEIAGALGITGLLAVELFDGPDGLRVNELAMRPHNSGHWTIEGARTSQFEQHLRAVLDLPLGTTTPTAPVTVMANVLGGTALDLYTRIGHAMAHDPAIKVHMYGKEIRPGRKIGHVTALGDDAGEVTERARRVAGYLAGETE